jgi:signal transduction histidine kinase
LSNALAHARRRVSVGVHEDASERMVVIEDDGPGFPADIRGTLFRRFMARARAGVGVGLWIAHELTASQHGRIVVEDSTLPPGEDAARGARFVVFLPTAGPESRVH